MLASDIFEVRTLRTNYDSIYSDAIRFELMTFELFSGESFSMLLCVTAVFLVTNHNFTS